MRAYILLTVIIALSQARQLPRASDILENVDRALRDIDDYTVTVEADVAMEGVRIPRSKLTMYFKKPDKIHFESKSFAMVPREGLALNPGELRRKYDAQTVGIVDSGGEVLFKLQLAAKDPETRLRQAYLWVDRETWTVRRLESSPYGGRVVSFEFDYERVDGRYWLASRLVATFGTVGEQTEPLFKLPEGAPNPAPQMEEMQRSLRSGSVTFRLTDYRVNTGLSDSLFTR